MKGEIPAKKEIKNEDVTKITSANPHGKNMNIHKIINLVVWYTSMGITNKIYYVNR